MQTDPSSEMSTDDLRVGDALLVVDVQNDFMPGGALPVPEGDEVVPVLNRWIEAALQKGLPVFASRDWHPADHVSFAEQGGPWPPHCVQHTEGAAFHTDLYLPGDVIVVSKARTSDTDAYSAFDGTDLVEYLRSAGVRRLWVGGLALDYCVHASVMDALDLGLEVMLIPEASRAIADDTAARARAEMRVAGALLED